jgi:hypothetical protein
LRIWIRHLGLFLVPALLLSLVTRAQQTAPGAQPQPPAQQTQPASSSPQSQPHDKDNGNGNSEIKKQEQTGTSNDRLFYALPNFLGRNPERPAAHRRTEIQGSGARLVRLHRNPWYGFLAGLSQAENSEPGYGQGIGGYGKRFGASAADGTIENFLTGAILPSLLHQDPRYFQSGQGGFWRRTGYSVSRIFVTRTDSGGHQFNYSEILGSAISSGISTYSYHPKGDRTLPNTVSVWGTQVGYDTITIVVKEFWPDIRRKLSKKK